MYVEGLLPANLRLVSLLEQLFAFERFHLEHIQMVNKASIFKNKFSALMPSQAVITAISFDDV